MGGKIKFKKRIEYFISSDGSIVEKELVTVSPEDFYKMKEKRKLAQLFREGRKID
ncbi:MAG: hypothetical protein QW035_03925 [Candidatus Anstonellales archaeon]